MSRINGPTKNLRTAFAACLAIVLTGAAQNASAQVCQFDQQLNGMILQRAGQIVQAEDGTLDGSMSANAVASALSAGLKPLAIRAAAAGHVEEKSLGSAANVWEVARRDKQVGAPSGSNGSTSLSERGAIPLILGLAVEHGAIQQKKTGESLTLSTSPYALLLLGNEDSNDFYEKNWLARMFGLSANFSLGDASKGLNDLRPSDLTSLSAKVVFGDRTTRSSDFQKEWRTHAQPIIRKQVLAEQSIYDDFAAEVDSVLTLKVNEMLRPTNSTSSRLTAFLKKNGDADENSRASALAPVLAGEICTEIYNPAASGKWNPFGSAAGVEDVSARLGLIQNLDTQAQKTVAGLIETFMRDDPLYSFTYSFNPRQDGSDYSELKLIGDGVFGDLGGMQLVVNASFAFNHNPSGGQETVRDFGATLSIAKAIESPLTRWLPGNSDSFSRMGLSLNTSYRRLNDTKADIFTIQTKFEIPITAGFSLPLSLSYATRSETSSSDQFKVGLGSEFDASKLLGLAGLGNLGNL